MSDFTDLCEVTLKAKKNEYLKMNRKVAKNGAKVKADRKGGYRKGDERINRVKQREVETF